MPMGGAALARELLAAWDSGEKIPSVANRSAGFDWDDGYDIAAEIVALRTARGEKPVGRKIGFTNRNIWPEYGATSPIWAHVYNSTLVYASEGVATVSLKNSAHPKIEPEIAFQLSKPIPAGCTDSEKILESVAWYAPSFEIVDCHFADWKFQPANAAADFSFHWKLIVGKPIVLRQEEIVNKNKYLRDFTIELSKNGSIAATGTGANALDHPALALAFLANILARQPRFAPLAAGEIITTGTLTDALDIHPGDVWSSRYEGLPGVKGLTLKFTS